MTVDESFKQPGAVPFKWEIRPGVPKIRSDLHHHHSRRHGSKHQRRGQEEGEEAVCKESALQPQKLKPPPSGFRFFPHEEPRVRSFQSAPRARSERWRVDLPILARPACVSPGGCFPAAPSLKRRENGKMARRPRTDPEPDYVSDFDLPTRRSASNRKLASPFRDSPSSSYYSFESSPRLSISSFLSHRSSPQPAGDVDWAGFGLF